MAISSIGSAWNTAEYCGSFRATRTLELTAETEEDAVFLAEFHECIRRGKPDAEMLAALARKLVAGKATVVRAEPEPATLADLIDRHFELRSAAFGNEPIDRFAAGLYEANHRRIVAALRVSGPVRWGRHSWTLIEDTADPDRSCTELGRAGDQPSADEFDAAGRRLEKGV